MPLPTPLPFPKLKGKPLSISIWNGGEALTEKFGEKGSILTLFTPRKVSF